MKALWAFTVTVLMFSPVRNEDGNYRRPGLSDGAPVAESATEVTSIVSPCPESGIETDGMCFWVSPDSDEWRPARELCQNHGGDLATFYNKTQEDIVAQIANESTKIWIGLRRDGIDSNVFRWNDGTKLTYTNWDVGQPDTENSTKLCVVKSGRNLTWEIRDCDNDMSFMCKAAKGACDGDIHAENGSFHSPNYPKPYGSNLNCIWDITVPEGYVINLQFLSFEVEDMYDSVTVRGGHEPDSPILAELYGSKYPGIISSSGNKMSVTFVTDDDSNMNNFKGFSAIFRKGEACSNPKNSDNLIWTFHQGYCYSVFTQKECDWFNSRLLCQDNGADLASIHSSAELQFLISLVPKHVNSWIGLKTTTTSGNSTYEWSDNSILDFQNWDANNTYVGRSDSHTCVYLHASTGLWYKQLCSETMPPICKFKNSDHPITTPSGFCNDGWHRFGNKCYQLFGSQPGKHQIWTDAKMSCIELGSTLASIHSKAEQEFLMFNVSRPHTKIWIGMYYLASDKRFYWTDNSSVNYYDWDTGEPNYDGEQKECVYVDYRNYSTGHWKARGSNNWFPYVCQITKEIPCTDDTCKNGGNCTEDENSGAPRCTCAYGYKGQSCDERVICANGTCQNGGICSQDGINGTIRCTCIHGYTGLTCEERVLCANGTCQNGGSCSQNGLNGTIRCTCMHGYKGVTCEERVLCANGTCQNGGSCSQDGMNGTMRCTCLHGYKGPTCEETVVCANGTCQNGGSCSQDGINGTIRCACMQGYKGLTCEKKITCAGDTCENGGSCTQDGVGGIFKCSCKNGYGGYICNQTIVPESTDKSQTELHLLWGIPIAIVCLILLYLLVRRLRRPKEPYSHLYKPSLEFTNPQFLDNSCMELENNGDNPVFENDEPDFILTKF